MKLFPAKCHERATLRKLWHQTGNSLLLLAKCWPLLHVIAGISARFSNFAFVLFCYITNHLMTGPLGNSEFCYPRISMFPSTSSRETLRFSGNKIHCSSPDQSLSVNCFSDVYTSAPSFARPPSRLGLVKSVGQSSATLRTKRDLLRSVMLHRAKILHLPVYTPYKVLTAFLSISYSSSSSKYTLSYLDTI